MKNALHVFDRMTVRNNPVEDGNIAHLFSRQSFAKSAATTAGNPSRPIPGPLSDDGNIAHLFSRPSFLKETTVSSMAAKSAANPEAPQPIPRRTVVATACPISYASVLVGHSETGNRNSNEYGIISDAGGGYKAVKIPQSIYQERLEACKFSIVGRVSMSKGDNPCKQPDLKLKLCKIWGLKPNWKLISLGRGFYHIIMGSADDLNRVWNRGTIDLQPGIMRFSAWSPGFDPEKHKSSTCQVWIKFHNLPYEFWDKRILTDIARGVGIPIRFDRRTVFGELGHFARVLVDIDLLKPLQDAVRVDTEDTMLWIPVEYENVPPLCEICNAIGHTSAKCRKNLPPNKTTKQHVEKDVIPTKLWRRKARTNGSEEHTLEKKGNPIPVSSIMKRINDDLQQKFPQQVLDHVSGKFVEVEDVVSSSDWSSSEDDFERNNGPLPMVTWQASSSYQRISQPISIVFPASPTLTQNPFELLSGLEANADDTVKITEITEEASVIDNANASMEIEETQ